MLAGTKKLARSPRWDVVSCHLSLVKAHNKHIALRVSGATHAHGAWARAQ
jgi:hypothetical protein